VAHYGRVEAMDWAEEHGADYIFRFTGNAALDALVAETAVNLRFYHAMSSKPKPCTYMRGPSVPTGQPPRKGPRLIRVRFRFDSATFTKLPPRLCVCRQFFEMRSP
jgi:hypothetical protein